MEDNAGKPSNNATVTVTYLPCTVDIGGTIYLDNSGLADGITGTPVNGTTLGLYVTLKQGNNQIAVHAVDAAGKYVFSETPVGTYKLVLGTTSTGSSAKQLPSGYFTSSEGGRISTGGTIAAGVASGDGTANGETTITVDCAEITYENLRTTAASYLLNNFGISTTDPLPVTLASFTAAREGTAAVLEWTTTEEENSDRFEVEHSRNGKDWGLIGTVKSHVDSKVVNTYGYTHTMPSEGTNYYRLKMVDRASDRRDESFAYSRIRSVEFPGVQVLLYPNPAVRFVNVTGQEGKTVQVYDVAGTLRMTARVANGRIGTDSLENGVYLVKMNDTNGKTIVRKFVILK
ncbi:T9SS type A sorting domain-containing protein [Dyadobacter sp. NIV53]|uniref:T9SS type A sorting domain-containing protein n=1 Tax=Dyadobacter sp. NIV53 TaxID=2861765 RepID=UPI001C8696C1|nr:T9SS type A sorting domain-containing protein [Dyadobacter sp. NIV53]